MLETPSKLEMPAPPPSLISPLAKTPEKTNLKKFFHLKSDLHLSDTDMSDVEAVKDEEIKDFPCTKANEMCQKETKSTKKAAKRTLEEKMI